jgi:hypothetical protein
MAAVKPTRPAASARTLHRQTLDDPSLSIQVLDDGLDKLETKVGQLQKLITDKPPTVTGAKAGNAALASLIAALAGLGLIKDATT